MFCVKCGKKIEDNAKFCQFCGSKITHKQNDKITSEENKEPKYIWGYKFTETDTNNLSVVRHYIESKGDYYIADEKLQVKKIYYYKSTKVKKSPIIIIYKQGNEVMIFGNEPGYVSVRSRFLNKNIKEFKKEQISFEDIKSKDVKELVIHNGLEPGVENNGPNGVSGWLALFILGIFLTAVFNIIGTFVDYNNWGLIDLALGIYGIYVGILLIKIKPNAIKNVKIYLTLAILLGCIILIQYHSNSIYYNSEVQGVAWRAILYGLIWLWYFSASKRVKNTYKK